MEPPRVITVTLEEQGLTRPQTDYGRCTFLERQGTNPIARRCLQPAIAVAEGGEPRCADHLPSVKARKPPRRT